MELKNKIFGLVSFAVIVSLAVAFFSFYSCARKELEAYKIGAILPLTGKAAWLGQNARDGIMMAVDDINSAGGIGSKKLVVLFGDSKLDPKEGVAIANKFIEIDKVKALIVNGTTIVNAVMPIADARDVLLFAQTIHPGITRKATNVFRIYGGGDYEWEILAEYVNKKKMRVGIFYINAEYGIDSKETFKKFLQKDASVVFEEPYEIGTTDFRSILTKVKDKKIDAVVLMGYGTEFIALLKQMREFRMRPEVLGNIDFTFDFLQKAPEAQGAIFVAPSFSIGEYTESGALFIEKFRQKFGKEPSWDVANSYDTIKILAEILAKTGRWDLQLIKAELLNLKNYSGVSGKITINPHKDAVFDLRMATLEDYKIKRFE